MKTFSELVDRVQEDFVEVPTDTIAHQANLTVQSIQRNGMFPRDLTEETVNVDARNTFDMPSQASPINTVRVGNRFYRQVAYSADINNPNNASTFYRVGNKIHLPGAPLGSVVVTYYRKLPSLAYIQGDVRKVVTVNNALEINVDYPDYESLTLETEKATYTNWVIEQYPSVVFTTLAAYFSQTRGDEGFAILTRQAQTSFNTMKALEQ